MKILFISLILAAVVCCSQAWDELKVTFDKFDSLPQNETFVKSKGWKIISDCKSNKGRGKRYILNNDLAVILVFDAKDQIAGISTGVPKTAPYQFKKNKTQMTSTHIAI